MPGPHDPLGEKHLRLIINEYLQHYHGERTHQGLGNRLLITQGMSGRMQFYGRLEVPVRTALPEICVLGLALGLVGLAVACDGTETQPAASGGTTAAGGTSSSGGAPTVTGGKASVNGGTTSSTGGTATSTGGKATSGGTTSATGGNATGGNTAAGGAAQSKGCGTQGMQTLLTGGTSVSGAPTTVSQTQDHERRKESRIHHRHSGGLRSDAPVSPDLFLAPGVRFGHRQCEWPSIPPMMVPTSTQRTMPISGSVAKRPRRTSPPSS